MFLDCKAMAMLTVSEHRGISLTSIDKLYLDFSGAVQILILLTYIISKHIRSK